MPVPTPAPTPVADLVARLPRGASTVRYGGRPWAVSVTTYAGGRSLKLWAEELGGTAFVSANVYLGTSGETFRPCEMPAADVLAFLHGWEPAPEPASEPASETAPEPARRSGDGPRGPVLPAVPAAD
ncbi:hypothetical protein ACOACO_01500 [Nocardioides sp. CPCC 205120]|uniref:hypothetical protein n=1 Tax=Nocardioides sp. CPCC 205120 TaxID=3406462 RepID=UPI003B506A9C